MTYHFVDELQKNNVEEIAKKIGFANPLYVEKFIMDFEMNYHISNEIDCILRGGMCMPFHTNLGVRRLSIDIDLLTELKVDDIDQIMQKLDTSLDDVKIKKHKPKNAYPIPNLVSYYVEYNSCFEKPETVKIDYLCDLSLQLPTQNITTEQDIIEFKIDYPAKILTRGALIGDKITTLALEKIGLRKSKFYDVPKQIYDIAILLMSATENDIAESLEVFETLTTFKVSIFDNGVHSVNDVLDTINSSIQGFLTYQNTLRTTPEYEGFFGSFTGTYLNSSQPYKKTQHISDILLVWVYAVFLRLFFNHSISKNNATKKIFSTINSYKEIIEYGVTQKQNTREDIMKNLPKLDFNKKILNGSPVEQVFLIKEIFSN